MKTLFAKQRQSYFALQGGEDKDAPAITVDPGKLSFSRNYECDMNGRYRRIDGYEAFDGQPSPSEASYYVLKFRLANGAVAAGATIRGATSFATATVICCVLTGGAYGGSSASGYYTLTDVSGTFQDGETIQSGAGASGFPYTFPFTFGDFDATSAIASGLLLENAATTDDIHIVSKHGAMESARDKIEAVPGSGSILGVFGLNGYKYAVRNNAGGTAANIYKATTSGWSLCDLGRSRSFTSGGTYEIQEGDVVSGATSAITATVKRVVVTSGAWSSGDAAGTLTLYSQSGSFQAENLNVGANLNVCTIGGNSSANALPPGGRYEFDVHNFYATAATIRAYGCNGVGPAFEWDGETFVSISTGMVDDTPSHIISYRLHLFLMFKGGSVQHSSTGSPHDWSALTGAAEIGVRDFGVGFCAMAGPVLGIWTRNSVKMLYGSGAADWDLKEYSLDAGGREWTLQKMGTAIYLDDRGLVSLTTSQEFGDFKDATFSKPVNSFLSSKMSNIQSSIRCREKNQYRLFFDDMQGLSVTIINNKVIGFTRLNYDKLPVCCASIESSTGTEEMFFGSTEGFVYQLDKGTSFNGNAIEAFARLHYNHLGSPSLKKRIRKIKLEADAPIGTIIKSQVSFDYGESENDQQALDVSSGGGIYGLDNWGEFVWGAPLVATAEMPVDGTGCNFSCVFYSSLTDVEPHTLQGIIVHYDIRGLKR